LWRLGGGGMARSRRLRAACLKMSRKRWKLRQKRHRRRAAARETHLKSGIITDFGDNATYGIVAFGRNAGA
jgi:hypothetical protein